MLAARIERVALRLRSDPRGGWEADLALIERSAAGARGDSRSRSPRAPRHRARLVPARPCPRALGRTRTAPGRRRCSVRGITRKPRAIAGRRRRSSAGSASRPGRGRCRCTTASGSASRSSSPRRTTLSWRPCCRRWIGCLVARQGRFAEARELVAAAAAAYEELGARLDAVCTAAFGRADVELLAGDDAAAEAALRDGVRSARRPRRDRPTCVGRCDARPHLARPRSRRGGGRAHPRGRGDRVRAGPLVAGALPPHPRTALGRRRRTRRGGARRARSARDRGTDGPARPSRRRPARACGRAAFGRLRPTRRARASRRGIELYEAKGNVVAVERARAQLDLVATKS